VKEVAEKYNSGRRRSPAAKAGIEKQATYRSDKPLRHPKTSAMAGFSAALELVPLPT
jgi:hypothetical protein